MQLLICYVYLSREKQQSIGSSAVRMIANLRNWQYSVEPLCHQILTHRNRPLRFNARSVTKN
jgi:hypothetical protein